MELFAQFDLFDNIPWLRRLVPLTIALLIILITVEMIRRRKLREEYAMLWLGASVVMFVFAVFPGLLIWLGRELKVQTLTLVVLVLFTFLAIIVMHFAVVISKQAEEIRQLAQRIALINRQLEEKSAETKTKEESKPKDFSQNA